MRMLVICAAAICGLAVGFMLGVLVGAAVPNSLLAPGVAPLVLGLAGGVGFALLAGRAMPRRQDGNARAVKRSSASP